MSSEPPTSSRQPAAGEPSAAPEATPPNDASQKAAADGTGSASTAESPRPEVAPSRLRRFRRYALEALAVVVIFLLASHFQTRDLLPDDSPAPNLALRDLDGNVVRLADFRGKRVLLHFWATWCGVCAQEVGALNATLDALPAGEALVTVVADGDDEAAVRKF